MCWSVSRQPLSVGLAATVVTVVLKKTSMLPTQCGVRITTWCTMTVGKGAPSSRGVAPSPVMSTRHQARLMGTAPMECARVVMSQITHHLDVLLSIDFDADVVHAVDIFPSIPHAEASHNDVLL